MEVMIQCKYLYIVKHIAIFEILLYIIHINSFVKLCTFLYSTLEGLYPPFLYAPANGPSMNLELLSSKGL